MEYLWGILIVLVLVVVWGFSTYNSLIGLKNRCDEAFSTMDIYLKKRYDLIPNLVETVKGYASHEKETLDKVISARSKALNASTVEEKVAAEQFFTNTLTNFMALAENYPELKANANFLQLQSQLHSMEAEIANSRKYYNGVVKTYNIRCEQIPSNIIANMFGFARKPLFEIVDEAQRENIKVQF